MAIPQGVTLAAQLAPSAISLIQSLFGGKSPQERALERLQKISEQGLDPALLQRALAVLNARQQAEQGDILARLRAGGIDPSSGLAQEAVGASRRGLGARRGEAEALFNRESEAAKMAATQQLAGLPADDTIGDLLGAGLQALQAYDRRLTFDKLSKMLARNNMPQSTTPDIPAIRKPAPMMPQLVQPQTSPLRLPKPRGLNFRLPRLIK